MSYKTNSLQLASYLLATEEVEFKGTDKSDAANITFLFDPVEKAELLTEKYFADAASISPLKLYKNYRMLRDLVFEVKRNI